MGFMNQLIFDPEDAQVAERVVLTYMKLFQTVLNSDKGKKSKSINVEQRHKFIRGILTGIGRAYPFAKSNNNKSEHLTKAINDIFRLIYSKDFGTCIRAMTLLSKIAKHGHDLDEKLYTAIYQSFVHPK